MNACHNIVSMRSQHIYIYTRGAGRGGAGGGGGGRKLHVLRSVCSHRIQVTTLHTNAQYIYAGRDNFRADIFLGVFIVTMFREDFRDRRDDMSRDLDSPRYLPPPRDLYYDDRVRDRSYGDYEDIDRKRYSLPLDDPYYRHPLDDLEPPRRGRPVDPLPPLPDDPSHQDPATGVVVCGSVILIPASPFDKKPTLRTKHGVCKTVFVGSLPDSASNKHLQDLFSRCGKVVDIRVSKGRNFGHVQFEQEEDVDRALQLSGCRVRIGPTNSLSDTGRIHVDYAQPRSESEMSKRVESSEPLPYSGANAGMISADLHGEDTFWVAAKNVKTWIERGNCNASTTNMFFGLISSCNTHSRKIAKKVKELEKEEKDFAAIHKTKYERLLKESKFF